MFITDVLTKTKTGQISHRCNLLEGVLSKDGKVHTRTIANFTHCNPGEVAAMRLALKHKDELAVLKSLDDIELKQGMSVGAVWLLYDISQRLGIEKALGKDRAGKVSVMAGNSSSN